MIVEYVRYRIAGDRAAEFESAYGRAASSLARAPQCVAYELARCVEDPSCYVLRITWTSGQDHLEGFRRGELFSGFLAEIRPYLDDIEEMRHYDITAVHGDGASAPTLYDWAGGAGAFERLTEALYATVPNDDLIGPLFAGMDPAHPRHVADWLSEVFGGPSRYTDARGGYPQMLGKHRGKAITEAQRRRWVALLLDAADAVGLPADPEFRAAFVAYLEWGSRLAVLNSAPDATPVPAAPVPHWGWGVAPPFEPRDPVV